MKRVIFKNGINVELAYHTTEVSFGDKVYTTNVKRLSYSVLNGDKVRSEEFDLNDYRTVYGGIEGDTEWLPIWAVLGEELACSLPPKHFERLLNAIRSFKVQLTQDNTNSWFADQLKEHYEFNGGYEE